MSKRISNIEGSGNKTGETGIIKLWNEINSGRGECRLDKQERGGKKLRLSKRDLVERKFPKL